MKELRSLNIFIITDRLQFYGSVLEETASDRSKEDFLEAGGGGSCSSSQDLFLENCGKGSPFEGGVWSVFLRQVSILKIERQQKQGPSFVLYQLPQGSFSL